MWWRRKWDRGRKGGVVMGEAGMVYLWLLFGVEYLVVAWIMGGGVFLVSGELVGLGVEA